MLATIETVSSLTKHPNADALDIAKVLRYDCIVRLGSYLPGDRIVFIQPDTVLPADRQWAQEYLGYTKSGARVRAVRLRGSWSMGIVMPLSVLSAEIPEEQRADVLDSLYEGSEVSDILGITKYEPPPPKDIKAKGGLPFGLPKTDEERWQNLRNIRWGEPVDVTLKIDGSSFTAFCILPEDSGRESVEVGLCSRSLELKLDAANQWTEVAEKQEILAKLTAYCVRHSVSLALRGELYGVGIQGHTNNPHSKRPRSVAFFSSWDFRERRYRQPNETHYYHDVCRELGLEEVPIIRQTFLTPELIEEFDSARESLDAEPFEGVVLKGNGFSFKVVNKHYDARK